MGTDTTAGRFRLLTVCTANQCRSPMAEGIAARMLASRGIDADVSSCGLLDGGTSAASGAIRAMAHRGVDLSHHLSRTIDADLVGGSDLVITMERRQIVAVGEVDLEAVQRTFTLLELADLVGMVGRRLPDQPVAAWVARAAAMRTPTAVLSVNVDDDLPDPMGGSRRAFRLTAERIEDRMRVILDSLFP